MSNKTQTYKACFQALCISGLSEQTDYFWDFAKIYIGTTMFFFLQDISKKKLY